MLCQTSVLHLSEAEQLLDHRKDVRKFRHESSTMMTGTWIRLRFFVLPPASTLTRDITSSSKAPQAAARLFLHAISTTPRAGSSRPSGRYISAGVAGGAESAKVASELKNTVKIHRKVDMLTCHLTPQESYDLLELVEARCAHGATIFLPSTTLASGMSASPLILRRPARSPMLS